MALTTLLFTTPIWPTGWWKCATVRSSMGELLHDSRSEYPGATHLIPADQPDDPLRLGLRRPDSAPVGHHQRQRTSTDTGAPDLPGLHHRQLFPGLPAGLTVSLHPDCRQHLSPVRGGHVRRGNLDGQRLRLSDPAAQGSDLHTGRPVAHPQPRRQPGVRLSAHKSQVPAAFDHGPLYLG